jgi:hypothetical protein
MSWVFTRLCAQKLQLGGRDFEYRKLYFPKDPTKGITITFQELGEEDLLGNQGGILVGMSAFQGLWRPPTLRSICGIPNDWDIHDYSGPAKVFKNVPFMVVPCPGAVSVEEHFTVLAQHGDRGLPWNVGNTSTPQDTMKFLGTVPKRIAYGFLGRPRFSAPWYESLFPGFHFDYQAAERENRSVFSQMLTQFRAGTITSAFFTKVVGRGLTAADATVFIQPLVFTVMDIPPDNTLARTISAQLAGYNDPIPNGEVGAAQDLWGAIVSRRNMDDAHCDEILNGILVVDLGKAKSKSTGKGDIRTARSGLSAQGATLVRELKRRNYGMLANRIDQWCRSFLSTELQGSVAEVIHARLEASLATPIQFGRGDTVVFLEPTEFAADENVYEEEEEVEETFDIPNPDDA